LLVKLIVTDALPRTFVRFVRSFRSIVPCPKAAPSQGTDRTSDWIAACPNLCLLGGDHRVAAELHGRFSNWIYVVAFAAVAGVCVADRRIFGRRQMKLGVIGLVTLGLVLRGLGF